MVPRETGNNAYAKFWRAHKEYYGVFGSAPFTLLFCRVGQRDALKCVPHVQHDYRYFSFFN